MGLVFDLGADDKLQVEAMAMVERFYEPSFFFLSVLANDLTSKR